MKNLNEKIAFVTGGSRGMGASISKRLAKAGATVILTYTNSPEKADEVVQEIIAAGGVAKAVKADNENPNELATVIEGIIAEYKHIDILVNNAGIYIGKAFEEHTLDDYQKIMAINVQAVFVAALTASKAMPAGGRIITIGSNMADNALGPQTTLYTMSKSALQGFTRGLARDLGLKGITVNLIQPGATNTDMNPADTDLADFLRSRMAIPTYGTVDDIAGLVNFLASEEGKYMTGSIITMDGGLNA
ncbi:SDR family oxidoreductase [Pedobacter polaris]|uniref:SDR family oxidoreductase n=1 Tax=Pedobacter polaris TaxID=2571273 RepID=A0A4U1CUA7_9SPHI|nr:SDR family oxidoreductase [Pedobacter polaris]TKC10705.1 SDR family oxidoreductase [Pedobacter polaris]